MRQEINNKSELVKKAEQSLEKISSSLVDRGIKLSKELPIETGSVEGSITERRRDNQKLQINSLRFEKLSMQNYGVFQGSNEFVFNNQRTVIMGANGTGKTTIFNALANLGPAPGVEPNIRADSR